MYIVISGNTGAGKSTLGHCLFSELRGKIPVEYVDEKPFHHDLIQEMFDQPKRYAFLIQMNFLLQRTLKVKYLTERSRIFLMERSLDEDFLFARRHYQLKNISSKEFKIYKEFWKNCLNQIPPPSLYIYLFSSDVKLLTMRVMAGYKEGKRKQELSDDRLRKYVSQMNVLYNEWFKSLGQNKIKIPTFKMNLRNSKNFKKIIDSVLSLM